MTSDDIAEIAAKLTGAQRDWLFAMPDTGEETRLPTKYYDAPAGVEKETPEYDKGCMVFPGTMIWLGGHSWRLSDDFITSHLTETGLAVRAHLLAQESQHEQG